MTSATAATSPALEFHRRYLALFQELTKPRYHVYTVDQFYHQGQRDPNKVQVVLRFDVDAGAGITYELAEHLHNLGLPASIYFLTRTATYPLDWDKLRGVQAKGFEIGLHSDHYYEQLTGQGDGISLIKEDAASFARELGAPVGMVWHGHAGMHTLNKCNWDVYKYTDPEDLGLRYHDGVDGPYSYANVATWGPPADVYISDGMQQYLVLWRRYLRVIRRAKPGTVVHLLLHPHRTVDWSQVSLPEETLPPRMTALDKGKLYVQYGLMGAARSSWRLATRVLSRGLATMLYFTARLVIRERKASSELLNAAPIPAQIEVLYQKPSSFWEDKVKDLGLTGMDIVLDVGAGPGQYSLALARFNRQVIAVEPLKEYRAELLARLKTSNVANVEVLPNRAEDLATIPSESADGVFCNNVLQYTDAVLALDEVRRVVKPGRHLFVSVPGVGCRLYGLSEAVKTGDFSTFNRHFRAMWSTFWSGYVRQSNTSLFYLTPRRLCRLLEQHGFEVERVFSYQYYPESQPDTFAGFHYYFGVVARQQKVSDNG